MNLYETKDGAYFDWLYSQVAPTNNPNPSRSYYLLLETLHKKDFTWTIHNDGNRVQDGLELRYDFLSGPADEEVCSFLEMLIALANRAAFNSYGEPDIWFWHMMDNLELRAFNDDIYGQGEYKIVDSVLDRVIFREYDKDGHGGLFPLDNPSEDQTKVELWYQLSSYLLEGHGP